MQAALLSFEKAPPFAAPLRFFLSAPLFAMLAGLLLLVDGPALYVSRWMPGTLAATHLLTVGFMMQVMLGALIQVLPVVAGANLARPARLAASVHAGLNLGTLSLAGGFYFSRPGLLELALALLLPSLLYFLWAMARALLPLAATSPTIRGLKLAWLGLLVVIALGFFMALALARGWPVQAQLVDLHAAWGLAGWAGVLLAAMAYVVVPMFQLTPGYPARPAWWFPLLIVGGLLLWGLALWLAVPGQAFAAGWLALVGLAFGGLTWRLQRRRRRARADVTYRYWQLGLLAGLPALGMQLTAALHPAVAEAPGWALGFGILTMAGGFLPLIIGMLYKILPFLAWLHLQNQGQAKIPAPNINRLLPEADMRWQFRAYALAVGLLLGAVVFPAWLARPAGFALAMASGWLWFNLFGACRRYWRHRAEIRTKLAVAQ